MPTSGCAMTSSVGRGRGGALGRNKERARRWRKRRVGVPDHRPAGCRALGSRRLDPEGRCCRTETGTSAWSAPSWSTGWRASPTTASVGRWSRTWSAFTRRASRCWWAIRSAATAARGRCRAGAPSSRPRSRRWRRRARCSSRGRDFTPESHRMVEIFARCARYLGGLMSEAKPASFDYVPLRSARRETHRSALHRGPGAVHRAPGVQRRLGAGQPGDRHPVR